MGFAKFIGNPVAEGPAEDSENGGDEQRGDGGEKEEQSAELAVEEAGLLSVIVDEVDAFHDELHDLRAGEESANPTDEDPAPGLRTALNEKFGNELAAAGREILGEVGDEVEHVGVTAPSAGGDSDREEQRREKCEEKIVGDGLGQHATTRENTREDSQRSFEEKFR